MPNHAGHLKRASSKPREHCGHVSGRAEHGRERVQPQGAMVSKLTMEFSTMFRSKFVAVSIPTVWRNCAPLLDGEELHREDHHHDLAPVRVRAPEAVGVHRPCDHALVERARVAVTPTAARTSAALSIFGFVSRRTAASALDPTALLEELPRRGRGEVDGEE
jgi:hypothetical protein